MKKMKLIVETKWYGTNEETEIELDDNEYESYKNEDRQFEDEMQAIAEELIGFGWYLEEVE